MTVRGAALVLSLLAVLAAAGALALPENGRSVAPAPAVRVAEAAAVQPHPGPAAAITAFLVAGAAGIGALFFAPPRTRERGPRRSGTPVLERVSSLVERARRGLAHLHEELQVVPGLLQAVDQQIDRLVRVQPGEHAAQLVQHRGLVGAQQ